MLFDFIDQLIIFCIIYHVDQFIYITFKINLITFLFLIVIFIKKLEFRLKISKFDIIKVLI